MKLTNGFKTNHWNSPFYIKVYIVLFMVVGGIVGTLFALLYRSPSQPQNTTPAVTPVANPIPEFSAIYNETSMLSPLQMASFVKANGTEFTLAGKPFYWGGTNNYYLFYALPQDIDSLFDDAVKTRASVVRTWLFCDGRTYPGGNNNPRGQIIWFQDINSTTGQIEFNDDMETGLGRFDRVLASARRRGIKLIVTLSNNWNDFGGADVYVDRLGSAQRYHSEFFTRPSIKQAFKDYISHVLNRRNSLTGVVYKNDSTILGIELMNEPRCVGTNKDGRYPLDPSCNTTTITSWANEMSTYIKTIDTNHLIGIGDEGFWRNGPTYQNAYSNLWDGSSGLDFVANANLPNIDMLGIHSYFEHWGNKDTPLFVLNTIKYLRDHAAIAKQVNKPIYLGEYGSVNKQQRLIDYPFFHKEIEDGGYAGSALWMLSSRFNGQTYPDYDGYRYLATETGIEKICLYHAHRMWNKSVK